MDLAEKKDSPKKNMDLSAEQAEADMAKAISKKPSPSDLSSDGHITLGPEVGSKETIENADLSKEALQPVISPVREKLEDFANGNDEVILFIYFTYT